MNFVFHRGIEAWVKRLWGRYFVSIRLRRVYTSNGIDRLGSESAKRIDAYFRNPLYARAESQLSIMQSIALFLFRDPRNWLRSPSSWQAHFRFGVPLEIRTNWSPVQVPLDQPPLEEFDDELEGPGHSHET